MRLNSLKPAVGAKKEGVRLGRGMGSGLGKTCGHGHKGQKSRSGYSLRAGFEGGQLPLYRRLPKFGFNSRLAAKSVAIRLDSLNALDAEVIDLAVLKAAKVVKAEVEKVKIILAGDLTKAVTIGADIKMSAGARAAIEKAGGKINTQNG